MNEYRTLPDYEGYLFGSDGSILTSRRKGPGAGRLNNWRKIKLVLGSRGYYKVGLRMTNGGIKRNLLVHKLILLAFGFDRPTPKHEVCHNNGCSTDNRIENLRWVTRQENAMDSVLHGTASGFKKRVLSNDDIELIVILSSKGFSHGRIASLFGTKLSLIKKSIRRSNGPDYQRRNAGLLSGII